MNVATKTLTTETIKACPVCGGTNLAFWSVATDLWMKITTQEFTYSKCLGCKSLFMSKRPLEGDIGKLYSGDYQPYLHSKTQKSIRLIVTIDKILSRIMATFRNKGLLFKQKKFYEEVKSSSTFVDFGCGAGKFLNGLKCKTIGVDFSPLAIESVKKNGHSGCLVDEFWTTYPDQSVDFLRMNHVVEHLYHPTLTLSKISKKIKPGGKLHIAVPNPEGLSAIFFKKNWYGLECPRHIILYKPATLINLLQQQGFKYFEVYQESISKDFIRSLGFLLSQWGLLQSKNVDALLELKSLDIIFGIPTFLASKFGFGDRYQIFCTKE